MTTNLNLGSLNSSEKQELLVLLEERERRLARNKLALYEPYPKQAEFHALGKDHKERLLMAANQVGKTFCGAAETAMHLTGRYPDWWKGRRFEGPIKAWAAGITGESTRDNVQNHLLGPPESERDWGTGAIPGELVLGVNRARGIPHSVDSIVVRHEPTGSNSVLNFKSYEKGREKWQGPTLDLIWMDEEPPPDIYSEALARLTASDGSLMITFTPLLGMSQVVLMYLKEEEIKRQAA